ncbi:hypothetical protein BBJ28_00013344 [Nothophytophthora sp. Chile5]|nr:hypothetical protein BBJ28_00013344 [Nothophytophthora sp. Chile5]
MMLETREIGPLLASDVYSVGLSSTQALSDTAVVPASSRVVLASSYRGPRPSLAYPATANWAFLTAEQHTEMPRLHPPSRPATAREFTPSNYDLKEPKRPATSRSFKRQLHKPKASLTPQGARAAIEEAARRERAQEQYVSPLLGRSVELRGKGSKSDVLAGPFALLSRARGATAASVNATERLRIRAFQARANGEYDRAIELYTKLTAAKTADAEAYFHLAVCLERTGQFAPALAAYEQVQTLSDGPHAFAYFNMGNLCMRAEKVPQAIVYFSSAIDASQASKDRGQASLSNLTPIEFYRQRGAAYRKNGDFEKAALDYVVVHRGRGVGNWTASTGEYVGYSAEPLYKSSISSNTVKPTNSKDTVDSEGQEAGVEAESLVTEAGLSRQGREDATIDEDETGGGIVDWALQRSLAVARLPSDERRDSDLQCLVDFMQQQFPTCAALRPEVCKLLCRELVMSPRHALPADTVIFLEQDGDLTASPVDGSLFFIFQGCVAISKTIGEKFQPSPQEERSEPQETQESHSEGDTEERQTTTWESLCGLQPRSMSCEWRRSQLELCELDRGAVFGLQGNLTGAPRYATLNM